MRTPLLKSTLLAQARDLIAVEIDVVTRAKFPGLSPTDYAQLKELRGHVRQVRYDWIQSAIATELLTRREVAKLFQVSEPRISQIIHMRPEAQLPVEL